jgi:hypothetical protein
MIQISGVRCCLFRWRLGKIEYLKDGAVKLDEIFLDEIIASLNILIQRHLKQAADSVVTVKGKPVPVCCQDKKKIELLLPWGQSRQKTGGKKAVGNEGKAAANASDSPPIEYAFFDHGRLLSC